MLSLLWLIPLLPLAGFAVNGVLGLLQVYTSGTRPTQVRTYWVACGTVFLAFVLSVGCFLALLDLPPDERVVEVTVWEWIPGNVFQTSHEGQAVLDVSWGMQLDPLSAIMLLFVTGIGFLIHVYSIGYMWDDPGFYRFFAYLNLFMFMMLTLVLGSNYLVLFVGWEGVGLCSYLLIGFYTHKKSAGDAAKKAFVVNRIGDFGFILGIFLILSTFGTLDFTELFHKVEETFPSPELGWGILSWIALLLFVGACGKSAQLPLYVWLPDAMEGPTPVSALIHAATMVTAGVYVVARSFAIFSRAPGALMIVAVVGIVTAIFAASIGFFQRDIKRVLAYSTVSQLGYMFAALGVGAAVAGIFHVFTHAFFKALLFLGSGSVIHGMHHEQDMLKMGGLKKYMPITFWTMAIGTVAIAGIPPLAGFWSKDEILWKAFSGGNIGVWIVGSIAAGMTAFYMFRLMFLTFAGEERFDPDHVHPHESPRSMTVPLMVLAAGSCIVGFFGLAPWTHLPNLFENFLEPAFQTSYHGEETHHYSAWFEVGMATLSVSIAVVGIGVAIYYFLKHSQKADELKRRFRGIHTLLYNKYYVDEIYEVGVVDSTKGLGNTLSWFDARIVDGVVNGSAMMTRIIAWVSGQADLQIVDRLVNLTAEMVNLFSGILRKLQTGMMQRYALYFVLGIVLVITFYLYGGV